MEQSDLNLLGAAPIVCEKGILRSPHSRPFSRVYVAQYIPRIRCQFQFSSTFIKLSLTSVVFIPPVSDIKIQRTHISFQCNQFQVSTIVTSPNLLLV